jgi:hypothetical protein
VSRLEVTSRAKRVSAEIINMERVMTSKVKHKTPPSGEVTGQPLPKVLDVARELGLLD